MANIHIKPDVESNQPKPYEQYRRGRGMPCKFMWNIQQFDSLTSEQFGKKYEKAFLHKKNEFIGGRNRPQVKKCKKTKCKLGYYSARKRSGCMMHDDATKCGESA